LKIVQWFFSFTHSFSYEVECNSNHFISSF